MIQLFMKRSGSPVIVPLRFPASQSAITEASCQLDGASREGKTKIVEMKSVIANLPSYLGGFDPDSRTQLAQLNRLASIIAKMDSRERNIYAGALDGNSINDLNDMIRVAEQVSDYILIPNVNSDVTLGRYAAVAGQIQGDPRFPEAAWPYLDFAKIGAEYYAEHGGAYRIVFVSCSEIAPDLFVNLCVGQHTAFVGGQQQENPIFFCGKLNLLAIPKDLSSAWKDLKTRERHHRFLINLEFFYLRVVFEDRQDLLQNFRISFVQLQNHDSSDDITAFPLSLRVAFSRSKVSLLTTCSIRQASRSAVTGSTPAATSISVKKRCFS